MAPKRTNLTIAAIFGIAFTVAWVGYVVYLVSTNFDEYRELPLNELGDFLAGAGGPIVLLWIVIGYFQQSAALRLQQEELRNQVEETKNLVKQATEQVKLDAEQLEFTRRYKHQEAQPRFSMMRVSGTAQGVNCNIENHEATVTDVAIDCDTLSGSPIHVPLWPRGKVISVTLHKDTPIDTELLFQYVDAKDDEREMLYKISANFTISLLFPDLKK